MHLGIDFGTCYSSAAILVDGKPMPIKEPLKRVYSFPSSVYLNRQGELLIGQAAENQRRLDPNCYCREFKRDLGKSTPHKLGDRQFLPEDLIAEVLRELKKQAEKAADRSFDSTVLTVPAGYQSHKRGLMEQAAHQAGFKNAYLIEEPVAAAVHYARVSKGDRQLKDDDILLVYDLGGGTFDAALIQKNRSSWKLLAQPVGDANCGGIDFDRQIFNHLLQSLPESIAEMCDRDRQDLAALRARLVIGEWCREFKHQLSAIEEHEDILPMGEFSSETYHLSQQAFHEMIGSFIDKTCQLCQGLVEQAGVKWEQVSRILLVGGSSRIPVVQQRLTREFQRPVVQADELELAICFGATLYGEWLATDGAAEFCQQGIAESRAGNYTGAIAAFDWALQLNPNAAEAHFHRGEAFYYQGLNTALENYKRAIALDPSLQNAIQARDRAEAQLKKHEPPKVEGLSSFAFEVVKVNSQGRIISRDRGEAEYFTEDLGNEVVLEMVRIPEGSFTMGSPNSEPRRSNSEGPQHKVTVPEFYLGKYPITQAQWRAVAALPRVEQDLDLDPSEFTGANRPVEQVSWYNAVEFCRRLSRKTGRDYRLPTEAEWEYACRAGTETPFHFGETISTEVANYDGRSSVYGNGPKGEYRQETTEVGQFPANTYGLYDMHGNVWEWCEDTWHGNYEGAPTDGSAWLESGREITCLLRGGSWDFYPALCRSACRYYLTRDFRDFTLGFRVCCDAPRTLGP